jgi:hypothetical protein
VIGDQRPAGRAWTEWADRGKGKKRPGQWNQSIVDPRGDARHDVTSTLTLTLPGRVGGAATSVTRTSAMQGARYVPLSTDLKPAAVFGVQCVCCLGVGVGVVGIVDPDHCRRNENTRRLQRMLRYMRSTCHRGRNCINSCIDRCIGFVSARISRIVAVQPLYLYST